MSLLRPALRGLLRAPVFTFSVLTTLALGFGAVTAMFSATYGLLWRPLAYPDPDRLLRIYGAKASDGSRQDASLPDFRDWQDESRSFTAMAAYRPRSFGLRLPASGVPPRVAQVGMVTADFFAALGVGPVRGRSFSPEEEAGEAAVAVLTRSLAEELFGAAEEALDEEVLVNDVAHTVLGILPDGFSFPMGERVPEAYLALESRTYGMSRSQRSLSVVARLRPGAEVRTAREELVTVAARLAGEFPETNAGMTVEVESLDEALRGSNRRALALLTTASLVVLLLACGNVAHLLVARAVERRRSVAVRLALGSGLGGLSRLFLAESLLLTVGGLIPGLLLAGLVLGALPRALTVFGGALPAGFEQPRLDLPALAVAIALGAGTCFAFSLLPTFLGRRVELSQLLHEGLAPRGAGGAPHRALRGRLGTLFLTAQVALSLVLLVACGLLLRSFRNVLDVDPGFQPERAVSFGIGLPEKRYDSELKIAAFHRSACEALASLTGVEAVGAAARRPLTGSSYATRFQREGESLPPREQPRSAINTVTPGYFRSLGIPLVEGRTFTWDDDAEGPRVLLVNRSFRDAWFSGGPALGQRLELGWWSETSPQGTRWEVVGVVGDVREAHLEKPPQPQVYLPIGQLPAEGATYSLRLSGGAATFSQAFARSVQARLDRLDGDLERLRLRPMTELVSDHLGQRRLAVVLTALFAGLALALTGFGIYGVVSLAIAERRRELAVRLSLGARPWGMARLVFLRVAGLTAAGVGLGAVVSYWTSRLLENQLFDLAPNDPATFAAVGLLLFLAALLSAAPSARRAARTDPMETLRE